MPYKRVHRGIAWKEQSAMHRQRQHDGRHHEAPPPPPSPQCRVKAQPHPDIMSFLGSCVHMGTLYHVRSLLGIM